MKQLKFTSFDGFELTCFSWDNVKDPKGVIQFLHGMTSHMQRYEDFAKRMNNAGFIVFGDDHRPHGLTAGLENLGKASKNNFEENVLDQLAITKMLKEKYSLPIQIYSHSYGSFLSQSYITKDSSLIDGLILSGSSIKSLPMLAFGIFLTSVQSLFYKMDEPNPMLFNMIFQSNNQYFKEDNIENAWLSRNLESVKEYNSDPYCKLFPSHGFYYSMMRGLYDNYKKSSLKKIDKTLPIHIISGSEDPLGKKGNSILKLFEVYAALDLNITMKLYDGARHELLADKEIKEEVYADIIAFYNNNITQ